MATIKLSKAQWQFIGKKAGWMKNSPQLIEEIKKYNPQDIINAFKKMGDHDMGQMTVDEIKDELNMCDEWELVDVLNLLKRTEKQEDKEFSQFAINQLFRDDE